MRSSICIKTNNKQIIEYLLQEFDILNIKNIYLSCYDFKFYTNVILHYTGNFKDLFFNKVSNVLASAVVNFYEPIIIKNLINLNYFYFSHSEKKDIYNLCLTNVDFSNVFFMFNLVSESFYNYISENKSILLDGFVNFKLQEYVKELDNIVDMCVNKFIIDREYNEFINLLKSYIASSPCYSSDIHLIYKNQESILLDNEKNVIQFSDDLINRKYLSDISFSSNDFALNSLLTLLPEKLYIHLIDNEDEFINTLKLIFGNRASICCNCKLCDLYKEEKINIKSDY